MIVWEKGGKGEKEGQGGAVSGKRGKKEVVVRKRGNVLEKREVGLWGKGEKGEGVSGKGEVWRHGFHLLACHLSYKFNNQ